MPKAYWIVRVSVRDPERYPEYLAAARPAFEKYGAHFIVRGGGWFARNMPTPISSLSRGPRSPQARYCRPSCVAFSTRSNRSSDRMASANWSARPFKTGRARVRNFCCIVTASGNEPGSPDGSA